MISYTFNSKALRYSRRRVVALWVLTFSLFAAGYVALEATVRERQAYVDGRKEGAGAVPDLMATFPHMHISGREVGNQAIAQNVALFSQYPRPESVISAYTGTSRSKILRPGLFGQPDTIVGAGNSYNEITYGLLLQAEILRLEFPNLKTMFVEASLLTRRPGRLIVEPDHLKYLPLLKSLAPLCPVGGAVPGCEHVFSQLEELENQRPPFWRSELLRERANLRLSNVLGLNKNDLEVKDDPLLRQLASNGERLGPVLPLREPKDFLPEVAQDNPKVQRLRDIPSSAPWDGLFDMIARWGSAHKIQIVFYQPPVRGDLYAFQQRFGLDAHVKDLHRVAEIYQVPFIDLDTVEAGFVSNWMLFSDEDHMGTCIGSGLLLTAVENGYKEFLSSGTLFPTVTRALLPRDDLLPRCER